MKKGAAGANPCVSDMACTSRECQRWACASLWRRKPPSGSLMRSRPVIVTSTFAADVWGVTQSLRADAATKPRLIQTCDPSGSRSGVMTQKPAPSSVAAWASSVLSVIRRPFVRTGRYSCRAALTAVHGPTSASGTGAR